MISTILFIFMLLSLQYVFAKQNDNANDHNNNQTAIEEAEFLMSISKGELENVKKHIENDININAVNSYGETPLHLSAIA
eukprot:Pgem_evm1s12523